HFSHFSGSLEFSLLLSLFQDKERRNIPQPFFCSLEFSLLLSLFQDKERRLQIKMISSFKHLPIIRRKDAFARKDTGMMIL
ncbi:MAG: hypothetical protein K6T34_09525, partial [Thermoflavifilum sp.]|nr:hypothetical protein [Thermoflavifilum sp.]